MHTSKHLNDLNEYVKSKHGFEIDNLVSKNKVYRPLEHGWKTLREIGIENKSKVVCVLRFKGG
jgi:hypothetical protein